MFKIPTDVCQDDNVCMAEIFVTKCLVMHHFKNRVSCGKVVLLSSRSRSQ